MAGNDFYNKFYQQKRRRLLFVPLIILLIGIVGVGLFFIYQFNQAANPDNKTTYDFVIKKGAGANKVGKDLERKGLISSAFYFETYCFLKELNPDNKIKAGTYKISPSMKTYEIASLIYSGEMSLEDNLVIPEGWTIKEIASAFADFKVKYSTESESEKNDILRKKYYEEFITATEDTEGYDYEFLTDKPEKTDLQGYLFPDTYRVFRDLEAKDLIVKMLDNFNKKVYSNLEDEIKKQDKKLFEIITLASIVQKEVKTEDEMKKVAGVYLNRLRVNKKLESDATITFITGKKNPRPTKKDTQIKSPYNTYLNYGLPPGPICNPGLEAIKAVIWPEEHDYFYFITRPDTGEAVFSKTAGEHQKNREKYFRE